MKLPVDKNSGPDFLQNQTAVSFKIRRAVVLYTEFSSEQVIQIHVLGALKLCSICFSCF